MCLLTDTVFLRFQQQQATSAWDSKAWHKKRLAWGTASSASSLGWVAPCFLAGLLLAFVKLISHVTYLHLFPLLYSEVVDGKEAVRNVGDLGLTPGSGRFSGEGHGTSLQYSCLEKYRGQRTLEGHSPWGCTEVGVTEHTHKSVKSLTVWG